MSDTPSQDKDPILSCALITLGFLALCLWHINIPTIPYFDEEHYLPAARALLDRGPWINQEHPMLGKELIALGIMLLGDNSWGWRIASVLAGTAALLGFMRYMWFSSAQRFATIATGILIATGFLLFVQSRIAMLDIFMVAFFALALWQLAAAFAGAHRPKLRIAVAGIALGLSLAAKWNVLALMPVPGLAFAVSRYLSFAASDEGEETEYASLWQRLRAFVLTRRGAPVPGVSLLYAFVWLGLVPLLSYALTYAPVLLHEGDELIARGLIGQHIEMKRLHDTVKSLHTYQSYWNHWITNYRPIWYLYRQVDGAHRGIIMIGNPFTMLAGLAAMVWCVWAAILRERQDAASIVVLFGVSLGFWMIADKSIQFYFSYLLPSCFLLCGFGLALGELWRIKSGIWRRIGRISAIAILIISCAMFAWFYPILSGRPIEGDGEIDKWTWRKSWI